MLAIRKNFFVFLFLRYPCLFNNGVTGLKFLSLGNNSVVFRDTQYVHICSKLYF